LDSKDKSDSRISHLFLVTVVLLWGACIGIVKSAYQDTHPILFAAVRFTISGILMLLVALWKERDLRIQRKDWTLVTLVGGLGIGFYQIFWSLGLERTSATNNALILSSSPLLGAIYADWAKKESVQRRRYWGMLQAFSGVILVILKPTAGLHLSLETLWGDLLSLMAAICSAIFFSVWPKPLLKFYSPIRLMGHCMVIGSVVLWICVLLGSRFIPLTGIGKNGLWPLIYAVVLAGMVAHTFWYEGIGRVGASKALIYLYFMPIVAALFNHFYLGETIFLQQVLGGVLILLGVHYALQD
jgi:drug/metabolite transporter (DMT)-like permease